MSTTADGAPPGGPAPRRIGHLRNVVGGRAVAAILSQGVVAATSLALQFVALRTNGAAGLGTFSLLFGILITVNAVQSGWVGDSLTVLDRFDPGIRRALFQSIAVAVTATFLLTTALARFVDDITPATVWWFGLASVAWILEETLRRVMIARREFWHLVVNDAAFAVGAFGLLAASALSGAAITVETLMLAILAGAVTAIAIGTIQLPTVELTRGLLGPTKMRELGSFAVWRAAQIGLRPGSQAIVRAVVVGAASVEALGRLEAARLLLAPMLTIVNGAGVYLLPTYAERVRAGRALRPRVPLAMLALATVAVAFGAAVWALRDTLIGLISDETVTGTAVIGWALFAAAFGAGVPAGNALVAYGKSRPAFWLRVVDAGIGVTIATVLAVLGFVDAVPIGLAAGAAVGAILVLAEVSRTARQAAAAVPRPVSPAGDVDTADTVESEHDPSFVAQRAADEPDLDALWHWAPSAAVRSHPSELAAPDAAANDTSAGAPASPQDGSPGAPAGAHTNATGSVPSVGIAGDRRARPRDSSDTSGVHRRSLLGAADAAQRWWWAVPLLMIVATEYKLRRRDIDDALSGAVDPFIAIELGIYGAIGVWAVLRFGPRSPRLNGLLVLMWGYILTTAVSAIYATFPLLALARAVQIVIIGIVIQLLAQDGTLRTFARLVHGWIVLITVSIVIGLAYVAPTTTAQEGRFTWLSVHSVSAGSMLALSVPVLFGLWLRAARPGLPWPRSMYATLLVVHGVFLLLTRTRGSIGGAAVAVAVMAWVWSGQRMKPQLVVGTTVVGGALALTFGGPILQFLLRSDSTQSLATLNRRTEIWTLAWESFLDHPLEGLGFTSARGVFFDETGLGGAHNALINVMIDVGLTGLAWWLLLLAATVAVITSRRRAAARMSAPWPGALGDRRSDDVVIIGIITASLLNSITTEGLGAGVNVSAIWWFLVIAWLSVLDRHRPPEDVVEIDGMTYRERRNPDRARAA